jgi:probable lipoprotein (TIGR04455 family)
VASCTIKHSFVTDTFEENEKKYLKRVSIYSFSGPKDKVAREVYNHILYNVVSNNKEYILYPAVKKSKAKADPKLLCRFNRRLQGVIINKFERYEVEEDDITMRVNSALYSCKDQKLVWNAIAENSFSKNGADLKVYKETIESKLGRDSGNYVAPFYNMSRKLFDSLPEPELSDDEEDEKIDQDVLFAGL